MSTLRPLATVLVALLVTTGCTGGEDTSSSGGTPNGISPSSSATTASPKAAPVVPAPKRAACYRLTGRQLTEPTNDSTPVPCTSRHTARTIFVGTLDTQVDGHPVAVDSPAVQRQLATTCPRKLAAYVGGAARTRDLSRFNVVWYSPTLLQSDRGADWFRCDLVAFSRSEALFPLPRTGSLRDVLGRPTALDTYGLCGTADPGAADFERVICARRHSWRAIDTIALPGGRKYPGVELVRKAGDGSCKDLARSRSRDSLKFTYGWEWPTRDQWDRGQRFGYCWVP